MRVFVHMPKCAGTSTIHLMNKYVGEQHIQWQANVDFLRSVSNRNELVSLYKTKPISVSGNPIIVGHIFPIRYVSQSNLNERFRLVTILRDPIQRLMSHYKFFTENTFKGHYHWECFQLQDGSFEEFAFSPEMQNIYSSYISGVDINMFTYIGVYEDLEVSVKACLDLFDISYPDKVVVPVKNKTNSNTAIDISSELEQSLKDFHSDDYTIYNFALNKFHKKEARCSDGF